MKFKTGLTSLASLHPAAEHAMNVVDRVWRANTGLHPICTGLAEEGHGEKSYHYGTLGDIRCRAFDIRTRDLSLEQRLSIASDLDKRLAKGLEFDIVWEEEHLHIEYDPKT